MTRPRRFSATPYLLYANSTRTVTGDGVLLVGDAAGVAYAQSGEGIRPAIESGLLAANVIASSRGRYVHDQLKLYRARLTERLGQANRRWPSCAAQLLPTGLVSSIGRQLLTTQWFARNVVLNRWFLRDEAAMPVI